MDKRTSLHESQISTEESGDKTGDLSPQTTIYATPQKFKDGDLDITARDRSDESLEVDYETAETPLKNDGVSEEERTNLNVSGVKYEKNGSYQKNETIKLDIRTDDEGDDTPTLPLNRNKKRLHKTNEKPKEKPPMYLFPILRLRLAWANSSNVLEFVLKATAIIFSTLGWLCCVGGIPLMSLANLIIGSIYLDKCNVQPNIPVYLVVSGTFGTLQHFIAVWIKYLPKNSEGRAKICRSYCRVVDGSIQIFLFIWFVLGCIWVYGVPENIDFRDSFKDEYCDVTVYYFAFWMLNISFILMALLIVLALIVIICVVISPKDREYVDDE